MRRPKTVLGMRIKLRDKGYRTQELNATPDDVIIKLYEIEYEKGNYYN